MKKTLSLLSLSVMLSACSSDSGSDLHNYPKNEPVLADIAGIWDNTTDHGMFGVDEYYTVIKENGDIINYDYLGDDFDDLDDCYEKFTGSNLIELGSGQFKSEFTIPAINHSSETIFKFTLPSENEMQVTMLNNSVKGYVWVDGQIVNFSWHAEYVEGSKINVEVDFTDANEQFVLEFLNETSQWQILSGDITDFYQDIIFGSLVDELAEQVTAISLRYNGRESDFTPLCADASAKSKINAASRKLEKNRTF